jgi:archaellum component FlaF (FlaF/FlaG flagellin family)
MGFSVPAAFLILAIAAFYAVGTLWSSFTPMVEDLIELRDERNKEEINQISANIEIKEIKVRGNAFYYKVRATVVNTGSATLNPAEFNILIDGWLYSFDYSPKSKLYPLKPTYFVIEGLRGSGWHQMKIISEYGAEAYTKYWVRP